ncbi:54S ribosomal protein L35, mitochondrial [Komagataella phaffii CBS 7435]|uniref:Large ribosomal subunit protein mL38 n=2 Tax=Komagataella phaffii TaxID=460519 RepID=C4R990_KOMPG|nr:54S ribosomal protein L35, mitochondrial [Komagataella phaffii GS115]AOA64795.1 GQ67_05342T0 [Komagataella phaffii]CAH2450384.1 54S ribosomal protein L35, mitochondrial [Komagataella phaffii CBS 7435]AOA70122.1 GQ68_05271T0 [Komagataella phaffii GS115]CAY72165.1 54S ribosomal protein L35, mitochondrial [Komagataella phaffii GS115]CCA40236.1 54S ribosomal protein L35, mitochondrial [Komagataella phaffii CBS 7435]
MSFGTGIWSNFSKRSTSLTVSSNKIKQGLLNAGLPFGPATLRKRSSRIKYSPPIGLSTVYPLAYEILELESTQIYKILSRQANELSMEQKEELLVRAEYHNPEVVFKSHFQTNSLDRTQPVYRRYLREKWENHDKMLLMQRLESLHAIPDTLSTLDPRCDVVLRFPHNNVHTTVEPGQLLSSNVTKKPPSLEVVEFDPIPDDLYTVLIVNPDTPDLENDTFSTTLHWALRNVPLSSSDISIDALKLQECPERELVSYLPPVPDKNAPVNRLVVWVFRQNQKELTDSEVAREFFDIRGFVAQHSLTAVGAHIWRSGWDRNVPNVRDMYGLPKGRVFHRVRR